jgi:hypothetical protein
MASRFMSILFILSPGGAGRLMKRAVTGKTMPFLTGWSGITSGLMICNCDCPGDLDPNDVTSSGSGLMPEETVQHRALLAFKHPLLSSLRQRPYNAT